MEKNRSGHLATRETVYVFCLALKIGYKTRTKSGAKNSLFQSWLGIAIPFSPFSPSMISAFGELIVLFRELRLSQETQGRAFTYHYKNTKQ